jgi:hypothetical protein
MLTAAKKKSPKMKSAKSWAFSAFPRATGLTIKTGHERKITSTAGGGGCGGGGGGMGEGVSYWWSENLWEEKRFFGSKKHCTPPLALGPSGIWHFFRGFFLPWSTGLSG